MTRGNICIISDKAIYMSTQFNGDMYPDNNGRGLNAIKLLLNIKEEHQYDDALIDFDKTFFGYYEEYGDNIYEIIYHKENYFDFSIDYFDKFNSDYIYIKNISTSPYKIKDRDGKNIVIGVNEIFAFNFGRKIDISEYIEKAKNSIIPYHIKNKIDIKNKDTQKNNNIVYVVSADTYDNAYGAQISIFGITDNLEKAKEIANNCGYYAEINEMPLNTQKEIYLGGYFE